jgi:hypothetical protein
MNPDGHTGAVTYHWCRARSFLAVEVKMIEVSGRKLGDIYKDLRTALGGMVDGYFHLATPSLTEERWPRLVKWIACYVVTGASEGHYIHVDLIYHDNSRQLVFLGKTFLGAQHAQAIAAKCAEELGA